MVVVFESCRCNSANLMCHFLRRQADRSSAKVLTRLIHLDLSLNISGCSLVSCTKYSTRLMNQFLNQLPLSMLILTFRLGNLFFHSPLLTRSGSTCQNPSFFQLKLRRLGDLIALRHVPFSFSSPPTYI